MRELTLTCPISRGKAFREGLSTFHQQGITQEYGSYSLLVHKQSTSAGGRFWRLGGLLLTVHLRAITMVNVGGGWEGGGCEHY